MRFSDPLTPRPPACPNSYWRLFTSCFRGPSVKKKPPKEGLTPFHQPADHDITIVAIHGLGGHIEDTWTWAGKGKKKNLWLKDNLPSTDEFQNARIYSFGYDANIVKSKSVATIRHIASSLNRSLMNVQDTKPLIFICHSLGGIIAKAAIVQAKLVDTEESQNLYRRVRGIAFFGTPHQGSGEADLGALAANILKLVPFLRVNKGLIKSLKRDKEGLCEISANFVNCLNDGYLFVVCFFETKMMHGRIIVVENSAVLTLPATQQTRIASTADHSELVKFCDDEDPRYTEALAQLRELKRRALGLTARGFKKVNPEQEDDLLRELHGTSGDYEDSLNVLSAKGCEGTSKWILEEQLFKDWESQKDGRMALWLKGDAGVGKSITLAKLVPYLRDDQKKLALYHFCSGGQVRPSQIFASLLHQLLLKEKDLRPYVYWEYFHGQEKSYFTNSAEKLSKALAGTLSRMQTNEVSIIIDALDECDDHDSTLVKEVSGLALPDSKILKVLVSSRPDLCTIATILASVPINFRTIELRPSFVEQDIDTYIATELTRVLAPSLSIDDISEARKVIKQKAGNNWLLTYLAVVDFKQWKGLWTKNKFQDIISRLEALGSRLYDRYDEIFDRIPHELRDDAMKLFKWLITAGRPLSIREANIALGLNSTHSSLETLQRDIDRAMGADKLRNMCGSLIHVDESIRRVTLLHHSVREYLVDTTGTRPDNGWRITLQDASKQIARDCITFLSFSEFSSSVPHPDDHYSSYTYDRSPPYHLDNSHENDHCLLRNLPFLRYAVTEWVNHIRSCQDALLNDPDSLQLLRSFFVDKEKNVEFCVRLYQYFGNTRPFPETVSPLHVVCYFGLEALIPFLTQATAPQSQNPVIAQRMCSPLELGALGGHIRVVEQLLKLPQYGKDSGDAKLALSVAVDYGHMAIVECLLQHFQSFDSLSPQLESAAVAGHTNIAEFLLKNGADVSQGERYSCPLEAAAYHGHLDMVRLLIKWEPNINRSGTSADGFGSALHSAAAEGHLAIVEELLESEADMNLVCGLHGTALQAAAHSGCMGAVKTLLDRGAMDSQCGQHGSALQAAKYVGHDHIANLLEKTGHSLPNPRRSHHTTTLDSHAIQGLGVVKKEVELGRIGGVQKRAERIIRDIGVAIERKNGRHLDVLLTLGVGAFKIGVGCGNENFLEFLTKTGMMLLKKTVQLEAFNETVRLSRAWAEALQWAVEGGNRPNITRRMLELCVEEFQGLVDEGRNKDAEELVYSAIEILIATAETENPKLLVIFLDVFIEALEQLMDGRFEKRTLEIIDAYAIEFKGALSQKNHKKDRARARPLAIAGSLALRNAIENKKVKVTQHLTKIYKEILQWMVDSGRVTDLFSQIGSRGDKRNTLGTDSEICLPEEALRVGACLLQNETTDPGWRKTFTGFALGIIIQVLIAAENAGQLGVIEDHIASWTKGIVCARPGAATRENIRFIFEAARDENVPQPSRTLRMSLGRIISKIDGISEVGT